ncbi:hypothetical protein HRW16_23985 [Streptomyces lunaelactis]|uniref:hypothetical protein n=1 Tax=Streptomyces lunaelactis TaxID=1535768 RepID=UPI001584EE9D|nr:hypothetical protein [Streptomyces lunaelactis]NUK26455.1 hypothetical protein [Streptomyces lunaelactis]NUK36237.1 hypothetical protein [Streptomyces lunaelactis]NUK43085.1 hypothetical protein [Streptomyces lunaelactis]NUK94837.1 hypothetical protein [Streptomyces lunaelactis]NUL31764.1 hypothetical protein [Streptomyces lunaelactis]
MRTTWCSASVLVSLTALLWATPTAVSQPRIEEPKSRSQSQSQSQPGTFEADCRTVVEGSRATAYCHNPYPETDRVQLHVECERWWDVDADSAPVSIGPAGYAELTERCWKEIREVWVSHRPQQVSAGT